MSSKKELLYSIAQDLGLREARLTLCLPCIKEPAAPDAADLGPCEDPEFLDQLLGGCSAVGKEGQSCSMT